VKTDSGAIVLGWLTKVVISLLVVGFLAYDGVSILTSTISTSDHANTLASEAADTVKQLKSVDKAYAVIEAEAEEQGYTIRPADFKVQSTGAVTIVLRKTARSLWMTRVGALKKYLDIKQTGSGASAP
jgi:hypothetical protein